MRVLTAVAATLLATGALAPRAHAQEAARSPSVLQNVYACADMAEAAARLACYDAAVAAVKSAEASGAFKAIDATQAEIIERESFGFAFPSLAKLGLPTLAEEKEATSRVSATVENVGSLGGQPTFLLDNGQRWMVIGSDRNDFARPGVKATVKKAALGSFLMSFGSGPALRVRRLE